MGRRILVTGGAGFIGRHLVPKLDPRDDVTVFDNLHPQVHGEGAARPDLPAGMRFVRADIRDAEAVGAVVAETDPDLVVHLAAETGTGQSWDEVARYCEVNVTGTAHLLQALRRLPAGPSRRLVLASSRAIYGEGSHRAPDGSTLVPPPRRPDDMAAGHFGSTLNGAALVPIPTAEDSPPAPASVYASTKLMQEYLVEQALAGTAIETVILRFQNVYGPGQSLRNPYTGVLSIFSEQILRGRSLNIFEDGDITRDFVFVGDVADAIVAGLDRRDAPGTPLNIGSGVGATIKQVAEALLDLLDSGEVGLHVSGDFRPGDVRHAVADVSRARKRLAWSPRVGLADGLRELASSVRATLPRS